MNATEKITLLEFWNTHDCHSIFLVGTACPAGQTYAHDVESEGEDYCDLHDTIETGLFLGEPWALLGTVSESGSWEWDGRGSPCDVRGNSYTRITVQVDTALAPKLTLEMRDDSGSTESVEIDDRKQSTISAACQEWVEGGEWGVDGASIEVSYTVTDQDGDEVDSGSETIDIEPDHAALIRAAAGKSGCGTDPDDHDWTSEGEGGCDENPGVWSTGGTSMTFSSHCRTCGLRRTEKSTGSQRNPGEHDTVSYEMPEATDDESDSDDD